MTVSSRPIACKARTADSRPAPGPLTSTSTSLRPWPMACREASCATICAAYAVLLRDPLNPTLPALDHPMTLPFMSVIVTMVLLNVARICATPLWTFLLPLALTIFGCSMLSGLRERFSAGAGAGAAPSSFFAFGAVFFFGSAGAAPAPTADVSALGGSLWTSAASGVGAASFAAPLGAFGFLVASSAGFFDSAIKLFLLWRLCYE